MIQRGRMILKTTRGGDAILMERRQQSTGENLLITSWSGDQGTRASTSQVLRGFHGCAAVNHGAPTMNQVIHDFSPDPKTALCPGNVLGIIGLFERSWSCRQRRGGSLSIKAMREFDSSSETRDST